MSSSEEYIFAGSDEEEYEFQYESGDDNDSDDPEVELENTYHMSKSNMEDDPKEALEGFLRVLEMEGEKGDWGFKALQHIVQLKFQFGRFGEMVEDYDKMLSYIHSAVTRNESERAINEVLDWVSAQNADMDLLQSLYETTLRLLQESKNERLWFKTNIKLGHLWLTRGEYGKLQKIMKELHKACTNEHGEDDLKKGTQLLEVYALEIQMYTELKDNKRLKDLYERSLRIKSAIPHPKIMGIIRECGGKMHMYQREWEEAYSDFFEAFKSYDDASDMRKIQCLKYLILCNMLDNSETDPFSAQETLPYKNDNEIIALTNLITAYQDNNIDAFEKILRSNRRVIMGDSFMAQYIDDLLRNIRTQVLLRLIQPYTRIDIPYISEVLNIPEDAVEDLCVGLILDKRIQGHIDQVNRRLVLPTDSAATTARYAAIDRWSRALGALNRTVYDKTV